MRLPVNSKMPYGCSLQHSTRLHLPFRLVSMWTGTLSGKLMKIIFFCLTQATMQAASSSPTLRTSLALTKIRSATKSPTTTTSDVAKATNSCRPSSLRRGNCEDIVWQQCVTSRTVGGIYIIARTG